MNIFNALLGANRTADDLEEIISSVRSGTMQLVDVRNHDEIARSGKAEKAIHIPLMMVPYHADPRHPEFHPELDVTKPVAVYCASGARSANAVQVFKRNGFADVRNVGGLSNWLRAGGSLAG